MGLASVMEEKVRMSPADPPLISSLLALSILAFGIGKRLRTLAALERREDDARFRELLEGEPDFSIAGEAGDGLR